MLTITERPRKLAQSTISSILANLDHTQTGDCVLNELTTCRYVQVSPKSASSQKREKKRKKSRRQISTWLPAITVIYLTSGIQVHSPLLFFHIWKQRKRHDFHDRYNNPCLQVCGVLNTNLPVFPVLSATWVNYLATTRKTKSNSHPQYSTINNPPLSFLNTFTDTQCITNIMDQ